jgi:hypothetical protein
MKTKTILTACLVAAMVLGISTTKAQVKVKFGPKAAFTMTTMNYSEKAPEGCKEKKMQYGYTPGFSAGMFLDVRLNPTITLGTELFVAKEGAHGMVKVELPTTSGEYEGDITTYYLQLPLLFKVSPFTGFNIELGPQFGYFLYGERDYVYSDNLKDWGMTTEIDSWISRRGKFTQIEDDGQELLTNYQFYKRWDMSATGGVSYRIDLDLHGTSRSIGLIFGARYTYGIFNTLNTLKQNKKGEWVQEEVDSKNSSISVYAAVRF